MLAQVLAGAERLTSAGQDHGADGLIRAAPPQGIEQRILHIRRQRVPGSRAVQRDRRHRVVDLVSDAVAHWALLRLGSASGLYRAARPAVGVTGPVRQQSTKRAAAGKRRSASA